MHYQRWWKTGSPHADRKTTHGGSKTRLYKVWRLMLDRCNTPTTPAYVWYGAKGVRVEFENFEHFREWSYANGYVEQPPTMRRRDKLSIDRLDASGNYSPFNCQWVPLSENVRRKNEARFG